MRLNKFAYVWVSILCCVIPALAAANVQATNLYQSVDQALKHSPQLKALVHNHEAIAQDLRQSFGLKRPSVDLTFGYGLEQHSDDATRETGAVPADTDWDPKEDASLRLTQIVYDGGETRSQISIQKALLDSADYRVQAATQAIALDAISAHLDVYMQRELIALARKNLKIHQDIYQLLAEREQAGAGDIADVNQTQARLARAQSDMLIKKADLSRAVANYMRVIGSSPPGELAYAKAPQTMPNSMEEALIWTEQKNPELLAFNAAIKEAEARLALARSPFKPKINLELSSSYKDNYEGSDTWQNTNEAMVVMRWNLYKGGQDKAGKKAALSRKYQSQSNRDDVLLELRKSTSATWTNYVSLKRQKQAFRDATNYSRNTFEAYLNQFSISRRSLIDVLNAESDYFQSASQLVVVTVNELLEAYRILKLGGELTITNLSRAAGESDELNLLSQSLVFPSAEDIVSPAPWNRALYDVNAANKSSEDGDSSERQNPQKHWRPDPSIAQTRSGARDDQDGIPDRRFSKMKPSTHVAAVTAGSPDPTRSSATPSASGLSPLVSMKIGPCLNRSELERADSYLSSQGLDAQRTSGTGLVKFFRVLEGVYPPEEARQQLDTLKKSGCPAFLMPEGKQLALYVGSFRNSAGALRQKKLLERKRVKVTAIIEKEIEKQGEMLLVEQVDAQLAETILRQIVKQGLPAKVIGAVSDRSDKKGIFSSGQGS